MKLIRYKPVKYVVEVGFVIIGEICQQINGEAIEKQASSDE